MTFSRVTCTRMLGHDLDPVLKPFCCCCRLWNLSTEEREEESTATAEVRPMGWSRSHQWTDWGRSKTSIWKFFLMDILPDNQSYAHYFTRFPLWIFSQSCTYETTGLGHAGGKKRHSNGSWVESAHFCLKPGNSVPGEFTIIHLYSLPKMFVCRW